MLISKKTGPLKGSISVPGDKSISHRSLMLGSLAVGRSTAKGLLEGEDVLATADALRKMGAAISRTNDGVWIIDGVGLGGLAEPTSVLDMGNSGTSTRLLAGLIAAHPIRATLSGDASLSGRPMGRVTKPLTAMGASFAARDDKYLPMTITGSNSLLPIDYLSPVASAQVKSAILLAGLNTAGKTTVRESIATRDHTERMLSAMGADIETIHTDDGGRSITLTGRPHLKPVDVIVPGDISSAAFLLVAASITPGSDLTISGVGMNPLRTGIIYALRSMQADITIGSERIEGGEPVADITVKYTQLQATDDIGVDPSTMIDEFPALFVAAASAKGTSCFTGLEELRVKESDRLAAMAAALSGNGVAIKELEDGLEITGGVVKGGGMVTTYLDHRIAMAGSLLGLIADTSVRVDSVEPIKTSFPGYIELMNSIGSDMQSLSL